MKIKQDYKKGELKTGTIKFKESPSITLKHNLGNKTTITSG